MTLTKLAIIMSAFSFEEWVTFVNNYLFYIKENFDT